MALVLLTFVHTAAAQTIVINGETFRDPTQPPGMVSDASAVFAGGGSGFNLSDFTLSFIRSGGSNPIVVINDQTLSVGDEIDGVRVAQILPGAVVLDRAGERQTLNLFGPSIRRATE